MVPSVLVQMGPLSPGSCICRCDWTSTIHHLGADMRSLKVKTRTVPQFSQNQNKTKQNLILEITKGQWI